MFDEALAELRESEAFAIGLVDEVGGADRTKGNEIRKQYAELIESLKEYGRHQLGLKVK
jgi:hypothetical protein